MTGIPNPQQNHLLAALPPADYERLARRLELLALPQSQTIQEMGSHLRHVYFPTTAIVSLLCVREDGGSDDIALVGREGIVGVGMLMGGDMAFSRAVVLSAGHAYRMSAPFFRQEFNRAGAAMHLLLRYMQALTTEMAQLAVCNRHHSVDQHLCRWLLLNLDRQPSNELAMTQELIATMLGVRRQGVTEAAVKLQRAGLIHYSRGRITVMDRPGLEAKACECYAVVKKAFNRYCVMQWQS